MRGKVANITICTHLVASSAFCQTDALFDDGAADSFFPVGRVKHLDGVNKILHFFDGGRDFSSKDKGKALYFLRGGRVGGNYQVALVSDFADHLAGIRVGF